jgi:hypothetical protein
MTNDHVYKIIAISADTVEFTVNENFLDFKYQDLENKTLHSY